MKINYKYWHKSDPKEIGFAQYNAPMSKDDLLMELGYIPEDFPFIIVEIIK